MKKILLLFSIVTSSCQELEILEHSNALEDGRPFVSTIKSDSIASTTAELYSEVISTGKTPITSFGHCWSNFNNPTIEDFINIDSNYTSSKYFIVVSDLIPTTKYYFRAFATNSIGIAYGDILSFTTNDAITPNVITGGYENITESTVVLRGEIITEGTFPIIQYGHCWSINQNPTIEDSITTFETTALVSFTSDVSNLIEGKEYYYRTYAKTSDTTFYGLEESFTTYGPKLLYLYNCESFEDVFYSNSYNCNNDVGGAWNILSSGGIEDGCFNIINGCVWGHVDYLWGSNYDGYIELWFHTSNEANTAPIIFIDGVISEVEFLDQEYFGEERWRKIKTEKISSGSDTIRFEWSNASSILNQKIDEVEIWEYK